MALQQTIAFSDQQIRVNADGTLAILTVTYDSKDSETNEPITSSTSFGSGLYFNSNQLTLINVDDIYPTGLKVPNPGSPDFPGGSREDESNSDNDPTTDQLFLATWSDPKNWQEVITGVDQNGDPVTVELTNFDLYTASFQVAPGVDLNDLTLNFVAIPANGATDPVTDNTFTIVTNAIPTVGDQNFGILRVDIPANNSVFTSVTVDDTDDDLDTLTVEISDGNFDTDGDGNLAFAENLSFANDVWNIIVNDRDDLIDPTVTNFGLTVQATDIFQESSTGVTSVTITDVINENPEVEAKSLTILGNEITKYNKLAQGDFLTSVDITDDKDISNLTVEIIGGNVDADGDGNLAFEQNLKFDNGTWNIVVNDADDLNFAASQGYDLEIQATDEGSLSDTGQVDLTITDKFQRINVIPVPPTTINPDGSPLKLTVPDGSPLEFTVQYESSDPTLGSFGLGLFFDSNVLDLQPLQPEDVLEQNRAFPNGFPADSRDDESNSDDDSRTDQLFLASWSDPTQNWPGSTPVDLYNVTFDVVGAVNDGTPINFTANPAQGFVADVPRFEVTIGEVVNRGPVFETTFGPFTIKEASPVGTEVGQVFATDPDGDSLTYSIVGGNDDLDGDGNSAFAINSSTGLITVNDSGDLVFATQPNFGLTIQATDPSNLSDTTAVAVNLEEINPPPVFGEPFFFSVGELSANGTVVGQVFATDPGDTLTYDIVGGNGDIDGDGNFAFGINSATGLITVNDSDDILAVIGSESEFVLDVSAQDTIGQQALTTATIDVTFNGIYELEAGDTLQVSNVNSQSSLYNLVAFYRIDDLTGTIDGVAPGDEGYLAKALLRAEQDVLIRGQGENSNTIEGNGADFTNNTNGTALYAPILIANGGNLNDVLDVLEVNKDNTIGSDIQKIAAYFTFGAANATNGGQTSSGHFRSSGDTLLVEDLHSAVRGEGEPDYNDLSFKVSIV